MKQNSCLRRRGCVRFVSAAILLFGVLSTRWVDADGLKAGRPFHDHMVLQRGVEIPVWGESRSVGSTVVVRLGKEVHSTVVAPNGNWCVRLKAREACDAPMVLSVTTSDEIKEFRDILIGDVWLCAGQSNMEWPLSACLSEDEAAAFMDFPEIRLLNFQSEARGGVTVYSDSLVKTLTRDLFYKASWQVCSRENALRFSAVGTFFGRHLHESLNVPIGLISVASGGTPTEAWVSREAMGKDPELKALVEGDWLDNDKLDSWCRDRARLNLRGALNGSLTIPGDDLGPNHSFKPGFMWEAAVAPLVPFPIRGIVWYQGESNAQSDWRVKQHEAIFRRLVVDWREKWQMGDLPFLYVQLPGLKRPAWPMFREQQRRILDRLPNLAMAVTIDLGHPTNVHPTNKSPVGTRLASLALSKVYGRGEVVAEGPRPVDWKIHGGKVIVTFECLDATSVAKNDSRDVSKIVSTDLRHFELARADGQYFPARATLVDSTVIVESPVVNDPVSIRYAWIDYPDPPVNFYNAEGFPASPFLLDLKRP